MEITDELQMLINAEGSTLFSSKLLQWNETWFAFNPK